MDIFINKLLPAELKRIIHKIETNKRLNLADGLYLYEKADLGVLAVLATQVKQNLHSKNVYYIKNMHIEPTNICDYNCRFCSYAKTPENGYIITLEALKEKLFKLDSNKIQEIHITGGVYSELNFDYYKNILKIIRSIYPDMHIKAYSAVEIYAMSVQNNLSIKDVLLQLKESGLNSIPGGGAEILESEVRQQICPEKVDATNWLKTHQLAHEIGIKSNSTMLYGHIETYRQRLQHMDAIRTLQDKTGGFNAFIPLKFKHKNNKMSHINEVNYIEDLKNYAIARLFFDNIIHIKAYWPMIGKDMTQLSLSFGVDDIDGTINDSTTIYSSAGAEDKKPNMTEKDLIKIIQDTQNIPVERDSNYNKIV